MRGIGSQSGEPCLAVSERRHACRHVALARLLGQALCELFTLGLCLAAVLLVGQMVTHAATSPNLPWRWSNPIPHGNNIYDLGVHNGVYWQVTDRGRIYRSTDRTVWTGVESGTTASLRGLAFRGDEVLVAGEGGVILSGTADGQFRSQTLTPPTSDWLEAVAASPELAVAVGDRAAVYVRQGNVSWTKVVGLSFDNWLRGVAYGAGIFVAVGEDGLIARSPDGRTWQRQTAPVSAHLNRVFFVNDAFYACGDGGVLLRATNQGARWETINLGGSEGVYAYAAEVVQPGTPNPRELVAGDLMMRMKSRPNGPWDDQLAATHPLPAPTWTYYASVWEGGRFVVGGRTGMFVESQSAEGVAGPLWFEVSDGPRDWLWDVIATRHQYIAVGDRATVLTSENGVDWYRESVPPTLSGAVLLGIGGSSNLVVAVGGNGAVMYSPSLVTNILITNVLITINDCVWQTNTVLATNSLDLQGLVWHPAQNVPVGVTLQGVAERDGLFVIVGDAGTVLTSNDGSNWKNTPIPASPNLSSVAVFPGGFVATGERGAIYRSSDGLSWESSESGTTNWVYRVRYFGDLLVAVGQHGLIRTSRDGILWQASSSGTTAWLADVAHAGGHYFICGTQGTLLVSADGSNWVPSSMITGKSLYGLAHREGQLLAVGVEGVILRAVAKPDATVRIIDYEYDRCLSVDRNRFLLSGLPDQGVAIERSLDLALWDQVGLQWFVDSEMAFTLFRTNSPQLELEFFRTRPVPP